MSQESIADRLRGLTTTQNPIYASGVLAASPPWWRNRRVIIIIAIVLLLIIAGTILIPTLLNRGPKVTFNTQPVATGNLAITVSATGPLQSAIYNLVFAGTGGTVSAINVKVGQSVVKG